MVSQLSSVSDYLVSQSWQMSVLFVLVAAACWGLRNASAHWRYWLWMTVLAKCVLPGVIGVPLAVLPQSHQMPVATETPIAASAPPAITKPVIRSALNSEVASENSGPVVVPIVPMQQNVKAPLDGHAKAMHPWIGITLRDTIAVTWLVGSGIFLAYLSIKAWAMHRQLRQSRREADYAIRTMVAELAKNLKLTILPPVYMADRIAQPFVWGWFRGSIYLPSLFVETGTREQQRAILTHELAHVARWDAAANLVQIVVQAVFFFHPLVWWTNRQIRREREKCCDEVVMATLNGDPKVYGQAIVAALVAEFEASRSIPSLAVAGRLSNIEDRIQTILNPNRRYYRRPSWSAVTTTFCLAACALPTALVLTARGDQPEPQSKRATQPVPKSSVDIQTKPSRIVLRAVEEATGHPVSNAHFQVQWGKVETPYDGNEKGDADIPVSSRIPQFCYLKVRAEGYVPMRAFWRNGSDTNVDELPEAFVFPMEKATTVGGIVVDQDDKPIPGAVVLFSAGDYQSHPGRRAEQSFSQEKCITDKDGHWVCNVAPPHMDSTSITISHPDYALDKTNWGADREIDKLFSKTLKCFLEKGYTIRGRVVDSSGKPVREAHLTIGSFSYYGPFQQTDSDGRFEFTRVADRSGMITVIMAGFAPVQKVLWQDEGPRMPWEPVALRTMADQNVEFRLERGRPLRIRVVDSQDKPIEGADVIPDDWQGNRSLLILGHFGHFALPRKSNANGVWEWPDAPPGDIISYDILKEGYCDIRSMKLSPQGTEVKVTLKRPQVITGSVIDSQTKQPVDSFMVQKGFEMSGHEEIHWEAYTAQGRQGRYRKEITMPSVSYRYRILADGYRPAESKSVRFGEGEVTLDFELTREEQATRSNIEERPLLIKTLPQYTGDDEQGTMFLINDVGYSLLKPNGELKERLKSNTNAAGAISPDGKWVVFIDGGRAGLNPEHGKMIIQPLRRSQGKISVPLIWGETGCSVSPLWSADSARILISEAGYSVNGVQPHRNRVFELATKQLSELKLPDDAWPINWSADQKGVLVKLGLRQAWVNADGTGSPQYVAPEDEMAFGGQVSPDDQHFLCVVEANAPNGDPSGGKLTVFDRATKKRTVVGISGHINSCCWAPDGKRIAYTWQAALEKPAEVSERETFLITCKLDGSDARIVTSRKTTLSPSSSGRSGMVYFFAVQGWHK